MVRQRRPAKRLKERERRVVTPAPDFAIAKPDDGRRPPTKPSKALLAEAADPTTSPARLLQLARHRRGNVRKAVAGNPNASREILVSLALTWPEIVANNPVLEWWLLEDANWLAEVDERARHRLLGARSMADGTRWWAARFGNHDDYAALLMCAHTTRENLEYIRKEDESLGDFINDHVAVSSKATLVTGHPVDDVMMEELVVDADDARDLLALARPAGWALELLDLSSTDLRRAVAAHASTTPALLVRLMLDDDERTIRIAEQNPNSELEVPEVGISARDLVHRVRTDDPTLTMEQLNIVRDSPMGLRCLVNHPSTPDDLIGSLVADGSWIVRQTTAGSSRLTFEQLEVLAIDDDRDVRAAAASNPRLGLPIVRALQSDRDELVRIEATEAVERRKGESAALLTNDELRRRLDAGRAITVAAYPDLPLAMQRELAASTDWRVRHCLAANPTCAPSVLDLFTSDEDVDVRRQVARNSRASQKTLEAMAADSSSEIRAVVTNRIVSAAVLKSLSVDDDSDVRRAVANNPASPSSAIRVLAEDQSTDVRAAVARRLKLPAGLLIRLAADLADDVRSEVVRRIDASLVALELAFSPPFPPYQPEGGSSAASGVSTEIGSEILSPQVCAALYVAIRRGDFVESDLVTNLLASISWVGSLLVTFDQLSPVVQAALADSSEWKVREALAKRGDADPQILRALSNDTDYDTRASVAANQHSPDDCIPTLAHDSHVVVRRNVAVRPSVAPELLTMLSLDDDADVRFAVSQRRDFQPEAGPTIAALADGSPFDPTALDEILTFGFVRKLAAAHQSTSASQLAQLAGDQMWEVRELVAAHMNTPAQVLASLAEDGDRDVRRNVAGNPNTPPEVIDTLASDVDRNVARAANANAARSNRTREKHQISAILRALRSKSVPIRILALSCTEVPANELRRRRHFQSVDWRERFAVATHPRTEPWIREVLAADGLHCVRNAAQFVLKAPLQSMDESTR
jgi:Leucine rich repeat variant